MVSAAAALAGLLFVSVSVNRERILQLGRMADRGLEALAMLLVVLVVASLPLIPCQPMRLLGGEILLVGAMSLVGVVRLQQVYLRELDSAHRRRAGHMAMVNRLAVGLIVLAGVAVVGFGDGRGLYLLPPEILLCIVAAGANAWVLLIEINR